jgi:hypothetical protein
MITTTHAKPLTSALAAAGLINVRVAFCGRCSRVLGTSITEPERLALERKHHCTRSPKAHQPSIGVPFS